MQYQAKASNPIFKGLALVIKAHSEYLSLSLFIYASGGFEVHNINKTAKFKYFIKNTTKLISPKMYKNYNPVKCNICFTKGIKTKYTKFVYCQCKLVRYCSEEHRIEDLEVHEEICTKFRHIMTENKIDHILDINGSIKNQKKEFFEYVFVLLKTTLNVNLQRPLYHHEDTVFIIL